MNFLNILLHSGEIFKVIKIIEHIFSNCIKDKCLPTAEDDKALIEAAEILLNIGFIKIEGIDPQNIIKALDSIKAQL